MNKNIMDVRNQSRHGFMFEHSSRRNNFHFYLNSLINNSEGITKKMKMHCNSNPYYYDYSSSVKKDFTGEISQNN